jgi:hypothetical protein
MGLQLLGVLVGGLTMGIQVLTVRLRCPAMPLQLLAVLVGGLAMLGRLGCVFVLLFAICLGRLLLALLVGLLLLRLALSILDLALWWGLLLPRLLRLGLLTGLLRLGLLTGLLRLGLLTGLLRRLLRLLAGLLRLLLRLLPWLLSGLRLWLRGLLPRLLSRLRLWLRGLLSRLLSGLGLGRRRLLSWLLPASRRRGSRLMLGSRLLVCFTMRLCALLSARLLVRLRRPLGVRRLASPCLLAAMRHRLCACRRLLPRVVRSGRRFPLGSRSFLLHRSLGTGTLGCWTIRRLLSCWPRRCWTLPGSRSLLARCRLAFAAVDLDQIKGLSHVKQTLGG